LLFDILFLLYLVNMCNLHIFLCAKAVIYLTAIESVGGTIGDGSTGKWHCCIEGRIRGKSIGGGKIG
jgi:hypothetical protein